MIRIGLLTCVALVGCKGKDKPKDSPPVTAPATGSGSATGSAAGDTTGSAGSATVDKPAEGTAAATPQEPGGKVSNDKDKAKTLVCDERAKDIEGNEGTSWFMKCPPCAATGDGIWGTDLYTDDSRVCTAAIHAGVITAKEGGTVLVTWVEGQQTYPGSEKNGITTNDYGPFDRSFFVQGVGPTGQPTTPAIKPPPKGTVWMSCTMGANTWHGNDDKSTPPKESLRVHCVPGCSMQGPIWGTEKYTGDSSACLAAVHMGLLPADKGGDITVKFGPKRDSFEGSEKNGVVSHDYGEFDSSFTLSK